MKKLNKFILLPLVGFSSAALAVVSAACQKQDNQNEKSIISGKTNQTETNKYEVKLSKIDSEFANWAMNVDNIFKLESSDTDVLKELQGQKLFYSYSSKAIIVSPDRPKGGTEWNQAKKLFVLKQNPSNTSFQFCSIDSDEKNPSDEIAFNIDGNVLTLKYKARYYKGKNAPSLISENVYETKFKIKNGVLLDNATPQTNVNLSKNKEKINGSLNEKLTDIKIIGKFSDQYPDLVAPSITKATSIKYDSHDKFYSSLEGKSGQQLIDALMQLQRQHRNSTGEYGDLHRTYRDAFVDKYYEKDGSLLDMYEEIPNGNDKYTYSFNNNGSTAAGEGGGWNCEHIIAQSWFGKESPMRNDAHHVWPTDIHVNGKHSNYPYGNVKSGWTSINGTKVGTGVDGGYVTEVINEFKGDVARAILYFYLTYNDRNITQKGVASRLFDSSNNNKIKAHFLNELLEWNDRDSITQFDLDRNNGIYKHQRNRNPFIDYPELVDVVFRNDTQYVFHDKGIAKELVF
ncbi:endonuclease [Mycoplasma zalophidermidis]|uniref:Endonuclease n=1 Tax=Mycoplasma zalophidermidis TaxID=398174 RepID=A0ABS6DS82_9MOLU|nr:endonuclease [Mycoplasma zalophidermidis]MBU4693757.1 endonuclease [Mycoplasma zalophidermidis]